MRLTQPCGMHLQECTDIWLRRVGWRAGKQGTRLGMGAFPCPRGQLVEPPEKPCKAAIEFVAPVYVKKKKAAPVVQPAQRPKPTPKASAKPALNHQRMAPRQAYPSAQPVVRGDPIAAKPPPSLGHAEVRECIPGMEPADEPARPRRRKKAAAQSTADAADSSSSVALTEQASWIRCVAPAETL